MSFRNIKTGEKIKSKAGVWVLDRKIGKGGNGVVWSASKEGEESKKIAIKFLNCAKNYNKQRFIREVTEQSKFSHESILRIYEYNIKQNNYWFSMPICKSYSSLLDNKNATEICDKFLNIVSAVKYIHLQAQAHRDIKPDNILSLESNLVLADFGLISISSKHKDKRITESKKKIGNFATIAPELRYIKDTDADFRPADVYSLAVTLWMLLTKDKNGFEGQYGSSAKNKMEEVLKKQRLELQNLHDLLERSTDNEPKLRPTIEEFEKELIKWIEATKDFAFLISSKWINLQKEINPFRAKYLVFEDIDDIVSVLNKIVRNDTSVHHCFLPEMGGLDLVKAKVKENGEIRLSMDGGSIYDCLPKALHYVNYRYKPSESYFFLETKPIKKPINSNYYGDSNLIEYTEFGDGNLASIEVHNSSIWQGDYIPDNTKSITRVYEGSFLFVFRYSLYNLFGPTYDGRHSKMGFEKFQNYYLEPYCELDVSPEPPNFLENNNSWEYNPEFYIYLDSLNVPKVLSLLEKWPIKKNDKDSDRQIIGSGSLLQYTMEELTHDFSFLDSLNYEELLELVCLMYLGRETNGKRIVPDIWNLYLSSMKGQSYEGFIRVLKEKSPSFITYVSKGLMSLGADQDNY